MRGADQLKTIVRETPWLMEALLAGRKVSPPDWLIGAGALRTAVWDQLHEFSDPTPLADIDLVFFDPSDPSPEREHQVEEALLAELPGVPWEATNQASVHVWFPEKFAMRLSRSEQRPRRSRPGPRRRPQSAYGWKKMTIS
jgi:uncharacterized protein